MDPVKEPGLGTKEIGSDQAEGRPEELAGSAPDEESEGAAGAAVISDARRAEALANPEVAADEASKLIAAPVSVAREEEAIGANPDAQEEASERLLQRTMRAGDDERPADEVKKQG